MIRAPIHRVGLTVGLAAGLALLASCSTDQAGWGRRGRYWTLGDSLALQIRRGPQVIEPATGELVITWLGVRAPEGEPPVLACDLTVFEDKNRNEVADAGEILCARESNQRTAMLLFDDVRVRSTAETKLTAHLVVRTEREIRDVRWTLEPD